MEASALQAPAGLGRFGVTRLLRLRSDDQLVALFRMGDEEAFRVIHDRYRQRLFTYTRQMLAGSRSDAEDALQDVFMRAYHALRADDRPITLRAWLYRVAHNRCIDQLRRPLPVTTELFEAAGAPLRDPLVDAERREDLRRLVEDVRRLPEHQRSALLMREMEGLTYAEVAAALGATVPAVKSLLVRARIGLVEAEEARNTACRDIRTDLLDSHDRGVRATGMARRHLRDCPGCRDYRSALRGVRQGLGALNPGTGPWGLVAKLLGAGGASSGAAAGGGLAVSGGAAVTATKVAAIVCCAAVVGGGAVEVQQQLTPPAAKPHRTHRAARSPAIPEAPVVHAAAAHHPSATATPTEHAARTAPGTTDPLPAAAPAEALDPEAATQATQTGGALAPDEDPTSSENPPSSNPGASPSATQSPPTASDSTAPAPASGSTGAGGAQPTAQDASAPPPAGP